MSPHNSSCSSPAAAASPQPREDPLRGALIEKLEAGGSYVMFFDKQAVDFADLRRMCEYKFPFEVILVTLNVPEGSTLAECVAVKSAEMLNTERERCAKIAEYWTESVGGRTASEVVAAKIRSGE